MVTLYSPHDDVLRALPDAALDVPPELAVGDPHGFLDLPHGVDRHEDAPPGGLDLLVVPGCNGKKSLLVPRFPAVMALVSGVKYASTSDRI